MTRRARRPSPCSGWRLMSPTTSCSWKTSVSGSVYNRDGAYTSMRTNIVIDDAIIRDTLRATGPKTKREAVALDRLTVLRLSRQRQIRRLRGKLDWQGDLDAMRSGR